MQKILRQEIRHEPFRREDITAEGDITSEADITRPQGAYHFFVAADGIADFFVGTSIARPFFNRNGWAMPIPTTSAATKKRDTLSSVSWIPAAAYLPGPSPAKYCRCMCA